jgi:hypothetical protein
MEFVYSDQTRGSSLIAQFACDARRVSLARSLQAAATQGAVHYAPNFLDSDPGPSANDRWFGTLLANGQGTTGRSSGGTARAEGCSPVSPWSYILRPPLARISHEGH